MRPALILSTLVFGPLGALSAQCEEDLLNDPTPHSYGLFGDDMVLEGDHLFVGSPGFEEDDDGGVSIFVRDGAGWALEQELPSPLPGENARFGDALSTDGDQLLVGAPRENGGLLDSGMAYLYERTTSGGAPQWVLAQQFFTPQAPAPAYRFGGSVAIEGDVLAIYASMYENEPIDSGVVYIYRKGIFGWSFSQRLESPTPSHTGIFGLRLLLEDGLLLVGAPGDSTAGLDAGAVFAYVDNGSSFQLEQHLVPPPPFGDYQYFGSAFDVDTHEGVQRVVIGGPTQFYYGDTVGRVYMYTREVDPVLGAQWSIEDGILATDGNEEDLFGTWLSLQGDELAVGAPGCDDLGENVGAVYHFERQGTQWYGLRKLLPGSPDPYERFGRRIELDGERVLVASAGDTMSQVSEGAVRSIPLNTIDCVAQCDAPQLPGSGAELGTSVAISGEYAIVGDPVGETRGRIQLYKRYDDCFQLEAELSANDADADDLFGIAVDIDGTRAIVGAPNEEANGTQSGASYVYRRLGVAWVYDGMLAPWGLGPDAQVGRAVAIGGGRAMASYQMPGTGGAVRAYREVVDGAWVQDDELWTAATLPGDEFGAALDIDHDRAAIGAPGTLANAGRVHLYTYGNFEWEPEVVLQAPLSPASAEFGAALSLDGARLAVGAPGIDAVLVYQLSVLPFTGPTWTHSQTIFAPFEAQGARFGASVGLDGESLVVGVDGAGEGAAYEYALEGGSWGFVATHRAPGSSAGDGFGSSVGVSEDVLLAGAPGRGAAYGIDLTSPASDFAVDTHTLSTADGGAQHFLLNAPAAQAGQLYWILGSMSGTSPGTPLLNAQVPLNNGPYFQLTLFQPTATSITPVIDFLDGVGRASAGLSVPAGTLVGHEGLQVHHAYIVLDGGQISYVSSAQELLLVP